MDRADGTLERRLWQSQTPWPPSTRPLTAVARRLRKSAGSMADAPPTLFETNTKGKTMKSRYVIGFCVLLLSVSQTQAQWRASTETGIHATPGQPRLDQPDVLRPLRRIHVLITADTADENIGDGVRIDLENMEEVFRQFVPDARQLNLKVLAEDELTIEGISRSLAEFRPSPSDAFVFFFSGHGCHNDQGHYFCMADGECLYRSDIVRAMQGTGIRLVTVLSNGCNVYTETVVQHHTFDLPPAKHDPAEGTGNIAPLFDELFLKPYGVVDINGASDGEMTSASPPKRLDLASAPV